MLHLKKQCKNVINLNQKLIEKLLISQPFNLKTADYDINSNRTHAFLVKIKTQFNKTP